MNYKLAKQLKDAGFPQNVEYGQAFFSNLDFLHREIEFTNFISDLGSMPRFFQPEIGDVKNPDLSELIEICGSDLSHIKRLPVGDDVYWWAVTHSKFDTNGNNFEEQGKTPEEAVARLWLVMNLKN
jgi:hypothetical protein